MGLEELQNWAWNTYHKDWWDKMQSELVDKMLRGEPLNTAEPDMTKRKVICKHPLGYHVFAYKRDNDDTIYAPDDNFDPTDEVIEGLAFERDIRNIRL